MNKLIGHFVRGALVITPVAVTAYVLYQTFLLIGGFLPVGNTILGFLLTISLVTAVGYFASGVAGRAIIKQLERWVNRIPIAKLLYTATKDLLDAVAGDRQRFDTPVAVTVTPGGVRLLGFVTRKSMEFLSMTNSVAVYLPQSYNFAGQLVVVYRDQVTPIDTTSGDLMTFIVSGGITGYGVGRGPESVRQKPPRA